MARNREKILVNQKLKRVTRNTYTFVGQVANMSWVRAGLTCLLAAAGVNALYTANSAVVQLTDDSFSKKVLTGDALWLVEFYAPW